MKYLLPLLLLAAPVHAQDFGLTGDRQVSFDLGIGATYGPKYLGSDESEAGPWFIGRNLLYSNGPVEPGSVKQGFSIAPSFNYISNRDDDDDDALRGLDEIDWAVEAGVKLRYRTGPFSGYGAVRKGFGGHHGVAGEIGADYTFRPMDKLFVTVAAEAGYGNGKFNETYFGITDAEAARTDYDAYDLGGGFNTGSLIVSARYSIGEKMAIEGEIEYSKLINDASDSPIVQDEDQFTVRLGLVRRFSFGF